MVSSSSAGTTCQPHHPLRRPPRPPECWPVFSASIERSSATGTHHVPIASRYRMPRRCPKRPRDQVPCSRLTVHQASVTCTPSTPAPARKRRRPNQDLQERLARCEELLKTYASGGPDTPSSAAGSSKDTPTPHDPLPAWVSPGRVVVENGSTRFMGSMLWTKVYDEVCCFPLSPASYLLAGIGSLGIRTRGPREENEANGCSPKLTRLRFSSRPCVRL
jgi:hypothetical protein